MKVVNLSQQTFEEHCDELREKILRSSFDCDCIVGIANGGVHVMNSINRTLNKPAFSVVLQRPSTNLKNHAFKRVLKSTPRRVNDFLRKLESVVRRYINMRSGMKIRAVEIPDGLSEFIAGRNNSKILIVDDAIDSGTTATSVRNAISSLNPDAEIRIAVITVTQPYSLKFADFYLYGDGTLIRFPWSIDNH